jgi:hypothetical protein
LEKFNYTVIIPHYNIPDLLEQKFFCLFSRGAAQNVQLVGQWDDTIQAGMSEQAERRVMHA